MEVCLDSELGFLQGRAQISMAVLVGTEEMKLNSMGQKWALVLELLKCFFCFSLLIIFPNNLSFFFFFLKEKNLVFNYYFFKFFIKHKNYERLYFFQ